MKGNKTAKELLDRIKHRCTRKVAKLDREQFGQELRKLRLGARKTLQNMADATSASVTMIFLTESGKKIINEDRQLLYVQACLNQEKP